MNLDLLKLEMQKKSISKSQLIKLSGVSETTIRRILHGKTDVHVSTLRMIADALGVDPITLIDNESPVPEAFDPTNVPEISAQVLEELTELEQIVPPESSASDQTIFDERSFSRISPEFENFYERMISYLKQRLEDSYKANEQIRHQNTELVKSNARLLEQEATTRGRNRALYTGIIIACAVAGLCLAGLVAYFVYDVMSPAWGIMRY